MPVIQPPRGPTTAPGQHNQPSRKGKKAWRKNVDVTDVEAGLDELNNEIIRGVIVSEQPSKDLFTFDTVGDSRILDKAPKHRNKSLRSDEIIAARSAIPAVLQKKRSSDKTKEGLLPLKRLRSSYVAQKELVRLRKVADGHHDTTVSIPEASYDIWDTGLGPANSIAHQGHRCKPPSTLNIKPISLAANGKEIPAVTKPQGGYSYNPAYADYETRLFEESSKAIMLEQKRLEAQAIERAKQEAARKSAAEADAAEARTEMSEWDEDSAWEGFESGPDDSKSLPKKPKRKTPAQRNKIKRRKQDEQQAKHTFAMKKKNVQIELIDQISKEVLAESEAITHVVVTDSESEGNPAVLRRKQLGKFRLPDNDLELILPDELQESLRLLRPEGNLLKDRYRSLLVRGKIESRRHIPFKKQAKVKFTEKWTHKDFTL